MRRPGGVVVVWLEADSSVVSFSWWGVSIVRGWALVSADVVVVGVVGLGTW